MNAFIHGKACVLLLCVAVAAYSQSNFTESTGSIDMVYVEGGTFQMGCSGSPTPACGPNETPVRNVTVSNYYIGKTEVTNAQWRAVMGDDTDNDKKPKASIDWYRAVEFVCELNKKSGKKYRLATEAEWEFAARGGKNNHNNGHRYSGSNSADGVAWHSGNAPNLCFGNYCIENMKAVSEVGKKTANQLGLHDMSGNVREWVYDAWNQSYPSTDQIDPTGAPTIHIQKIRRGGGYLTGAEEATVTARKIRSIEGADSDVGFRLALSTNQNSIPSGMVDACDIHRPPVSHGKNTKRDDRLITGNDYAWVNETVWSGNTFTSVLKIWDDGTAVMRNSMGQTVSGEWATGNDFSLYIMTSSGTRNKYIYYVVSPKMEITLMPENDMPNRWEYKPASDVNVSITKPSLSNPPRTPDQIIPAGTVVDMDNPPKTGKDQRLIVATSLTAGPQAWVQDNVALGAGGTHRYRFDYTNDTARFVVWDPGMSTSVIISAGKWFTIDDTFLRITGSNGKTYDYLYNVTSGSDPTHYHISFQGYERGDFRMFKKFAIADVPNWMNPTMEPYANAANGGSTYLSPSEVADLPTPIMRPQIPSGQVFAYAVKGAIMLGNVPKGAKAQVYNLSGKLIATSHSPMATSHLQINVQTAGMYIVKVNNQTLRIFLTGGP